MSTTKKVILKKDRRNPKLGYLKLQTITNRKSKEKSLKIKIQVKNWNPDKQFVYSTEPNADKLNEFIQKILSIEEKGKVIQKINEDSLFSFAEKVIKVIPYEGTRQTKRFAFNKLKGYVESTGKEDLLFPEIDLFFIKTYYSYLLESCEISTANAYMTNFKYFIHQAEEHGQHTYAINPFRTFKKRRKKNTHTVLTQYEVQEFRKYVSTDKAYLQVHQGFIFMMYAAGMRISDLLNLKWENFKKQGESYYVEYHMQKTGRLMKPKLTLEALECLIPFIEEYGKELISSYYFVKKIIEKDMKSLELLREDIKELKPITIYDVFISGKYKEKLYEGMEIEKKQNAVKDTIKIYQDSIEYNRNKLVSTIAEICLNLKDLYPTENVLPHCRGVSDEDMYKVTHAAKTQFNYRLKSIQKKLGIKTTITNHQARHIFAQRLFESGANFHYISLALGHSSLQITENYREQLVTDDARDVVEVFSELLRTSKYKETPKLIEVSKSNKH